jgi:hypothetical protein
MESLDNVIIVDEASVPIKEEIQSDIKDTKIVDALLKGNEGLNSRFEQEDWEAAEKPVTEFDKKVINVLKNFASGIDVQENDMNLLIVFGEKFYVSIRPLLKKFKFGALVYGDVVYEDPDKKKGKKMKKVGMDPEEIRFLNSKKKVEEKVATLLNSFSDREMSTNYGLENCEYLELKAVTLMYAIMFILANDKKYKKESKLPDVYELIVGVQKFLNYVKDYKGKSIINQGILDSVSYTMENDLKFWLAKLIEKYPFDGIKIYEIEPRLLVYTKYDHIIPSKGIKPRKNQIDLINTITSNLDGFLIVYKAMVASGKTTTGGICIPSLINALRIKGKASGSEFNKQLIFCCNIRSVKDQVAQLAYNGGIKFAISHIKADGTLKVTNSFNCDKDSDRLLIICSPDAATELLKRDQSDSYWLFLDEPTIGADQYEHEALKNNVNVMYHMPKWTILSSATMPDINKIDNVVNHYKTKFPDVSIHTVYSSETQIACDLKTFESEIVLPHLGCKNKKQLEYVIDKIMNNPFLGRLYSSSVVLFLWNLLQTKKLEDLPNIRVLFSDVNNLSCDRVREVAMEMLNKLAQTNDDALIQEICSSKITEEKEIKKNNDDSESGIVWEDEEENNDDTIDFTKLGTTHAFKFLNMNLVTTNDPVKFAEENFKGLLDKIRDYGCLSAKKIINTYEKASETYKKVLERMNDTSRAIRNEKSKNDDSHTMKDERFEKLQELESSPPKMDFPDFGHINSMSHIEKFAKSHIKQINPRFIRMEYPIETLPFNTPVPDWMMLLLFAGVGLIIPGNRLINEEYTRAVLSMASAGNLAYLIADSSICYGTNYPINRVIITKEFADSHSINTLFQLMGRAGRVGQSWRAEAFLNNETAKKLIKYVQDPKDKSDYVEINNIQLTFSNLIKQMEDLIELQKKLEEEERIAQEEFAKRKIIEEARQEIIRIRMEADKKKKAIDDAKKFAAEAEARKLANNNNQRFGRGDRFEGRNDNRYNDNRYNDNRHTDQRYEANTRNAGANPRYDANQRYADANPRYADANPRYADANPRYADANPRYADANPRYADANPRYAETNQRHEANQRYAEANPRYAVQNNDQYNNRDRQIKHPSILDNPRFKSDETAEAPSDMGWRRKPSDKPVEAEKKVIIDPKTIEPIVEVDMVGWETVQTKKPKEENIMPRRTNESRKPIARNYIKSNRN